MRDNFKSLKVGHLSPLMLLLPSLRFVPGVGSDWPEFTPRIHSLSQTNNI